MQRIDASWPEVEGIVAFTTTRLDGCSLAPFTGFNLGLHVGDEAKAVEDNRSLLLRECGLQDAQWLEQVHGIECVKAVRNKEVPVADACWSDEAQLACIVMTADCLPVVFRQGKKIAAAHAGWRGLLDGVLESTLNHFDPTLTDIWFGPAIGARAFEVGPEVREQFIQRDENCALAFKPSLNSGKWLADIYQLARIRLMSAGVDANRIYGGEHCTYTNDEQFYSYRRDGVTGRIATVIYRDTPID